jgi:hypothetical protein
MSHHQRLACLCQVANPRQSAALFPAANLSAHRHAHNEILASTTVLLGASAVLAPVSLPVAASPYIPKRAEGCVSQQNDTSTKTAITTIRATMRHELLTPKADDARATIASSDRDFNLIDHSS